MPGPSLRPRSVSDKLLGRNSNASRSSIVGSLLNPSRNKMRSMDTDGPLSPPLSDLNTHLSITGDSDGTSPVSPVGPLPSELFKSAHQPPSTPAPSMTGNSLHDPSRTTEPRSTSVPTPANSPPARSGSTWGLDDGRVVVEQEAAASMYPVILGKGEDIDSILADGQATMERMRGSVVAQRTLMRSGNRKRSSSIGVLERPGVRDIDELTATDSPLTGGVVPSDTKSPRMSLARIANGMRSRRQSEVIQYNPSASARGSRMSLAETFPALGKSMVGLSAPTPCAPADSLPESHFPQTLTAASEDIDQFTGIGTGEIMANVGRSRSASVATTMETPLTVEEMDFDDMLALGDTVEKENRSRRGSTSSQKEGGGGWKRRLSFVIITRSRRGSTSSSAQPSPLSPRRGCSVTTSAAEEIRDIDDVLSHDPNPGAQALADLPRNFTDAGDFELLASVPAPSPTLSRLKGEHHGSSLPALIRRLSGDQSPRSERQSHASLKISPHLGATRVSDSGTPDHTSHYKTSRNDSDIPSAYCLRNEDNAAEDISALLDIGRSSFASSHHMGMSPTIQEDGDGVCDISALMDLGETPYGTKNNRTSTAIPRSPVDGVRDATSPTDASPAEMSAGAPSSSTNDSPVADRRGLPTVTLDGGKSPITSPTQQRSITNLDRRVSFTKISHDAIESRMPTSAQTSAPTYDTALSLDIDQYVAGQLPPSPSYQRKRNSQGSVLLKAVTNGKARRSIFASRAEFFAPTMANTSASGYLAHTTSGVIGQRNTSDGEIPYVSGTVTPPHPSHIHESRVASSRNSHTKRPRSVSEPQRKLDSHHQRKHPTHPQNPTRTGSIAVVPPSPRNQRRRLSALDITHFMSIADMVQADCEGIAPSATAVRVDVVEKSENAPDIKQFIRFGRQGSGAVGGSHGNGSVGGLAGAAHEMGSYQSNSSDEDVANEYSTVTNPLAVERSNAILSAPTSPTAVTGSRQTLETVLQQGRRASSLGNILHSAIMHGQSAISSQHATFRVPTTPTPSEGHAPTTESHPDETSLDATQKLKRLRQSLDELALGPRSARRWSKALGGEAVHSPQSRKMNANASIVDLTPPRIDIDELVRFQVSIYPHAVLIVSNALADRFAGVLKCRSPWNANFLSSRTLLPQVPGQPS
ncbi:hypothetical protein DFS34DRAFT_245680 [Phlyctochytrium arcticum]|nr:hypothetical protein DFS34DRAFT_245680 [Phlyctochytrium arcticum]